MINENTDGQVRKLGGNKKGAVISISALSRRGLALFGHSRRVDASTRHLVHSSRHLVFI